MSIADHFEQAPDAGFVRKYDTGSARRQLNVSLMLVIVIAAAASALGFLVNFDQPKTFDQPSADVRAASTAPAYVGALTR